MTMDRIAKMVAFAAVQLVLTSCQTESSAEPERSAAEALEHDLGGPGALMDFLSTSNHAQIAATLESYGMGYEMHHVGPDDKNITDCPQYFPSSDRNKWHAFDGEFYYIDGSGRPQRSYKYLPPISAAPRNETCQGNVGRWGDAENPGNNYDGGHLIAASLGGWGKRANLVPQDSNFNQGNWNQIEQQAAKCGALSSQRMLYQVTLSYPNGSTLIPSTFSLYLEDRSQGDSISRSFQNVDLGGSSGTSNRQALINFLIANGCN
ncbi:MAG TPA: DNA/RNA non-specific endonuclease [Polyangiaceae bacterium]|nr:DNA/RNA non-specific endonuclease [Polyangiaceae bacterium]